MIGETIGSYKVLRQIGEGGMGVVYLAEHTVIGKHAAIKMLLPQYSKQEAIVTRFFNEARATAKTQHPGLIEIHDFGHHANGSAFIVMEFLDGESLAHKLKREGAQQLPLVIELARQIAAALQAAHAVGVVHRDLKPDNVFLIKSEELQCGLRAKVLDFGIAKVIDQASTSQMKTRTGILMGTPAYMSPEQCQGASRVDQRADVYSLGCIMFEMVMARPPFVAEGLGGVIAAHLYEAVPPLTGMPQLEPVVKRALAKKVEERYQNMGELLADLDALLMRRPLAKRPAPVDVKADTIFHDPAARTARGRWLAAAGALALAAAGGFWLVQHRRAVATPYAATAPATAPGGDRAAAPPSAAPAAAPQNAPAAAPQNAPAAAPQNAPAAPALPERVALTLESTPPGATVFRAADGVRVGKTPFNTTVARGDGEAIFLLKLAGYHDASVTFPASQDAAKTILLSRAGAHVGPPAQAHPAQAPPPPPQAARAQPPDPDKPAPKSRSLQSGELHSPF
jgi:serine/threonine-protein kinase